MITFRRYQYKDNLFEGDFLLVRDFLLELNNPTFSFGWWDYQKTCPSFHADDLNKFGLWFEGEQLVALACAEEDLGTGILIAKNGCQTLIGEMIEYAKENLHDNGKFSLMIPDSDKVYQTAAANAGFFPTQERDTDSIIQIDSKNLQYTLPEGFKIISMADDYNPVQFDRIMRRGFSGDMEERALSSDERKAIDRQFMRPLMNLDLQIAVVAPDESWAAFCGMWQTAESKTAFIEPVVTDPAYQKMGLGKAAVYEALSRCGKLGASSAVVFSSLQFYFRIGFHPNATSTWWKKSE